MHDRLRAARLAAGFATAKDAAERFGWNQNTYTSHENGNRDIPLGRAIDYAAAFKVHFPWLVKGDGPMRSGNRKVQVVGYVGAGSVVFPIDDNGFEEIEPPFDAPEGSVAFVVRGDSMYPMMPANSHIIALPMADTHAIVHKRAVVTLDDGRRLVKDVLPGSRADVFTLVSYNAAPIQDAKIVACAKVIAVLLP
jgi:hypothetical protein